MAIWIALLRGINVGGRNKIKMAELREALEQSGLDNVETYIQSGNLIFDSTSTRIENEQLIHESIRERWTYDVPVMAVKASELRKSASANPFPSRDIVSIHLTILEKKPTRQLVSAVESLDIGDDEVVVKGRHVYLCLAHGYAKTKLNNGFLESKFQCKATTRNWKTVTKLVELCKNRS